MTLLELILGIALLGIAVTVIVGAWSTNITATRQHRDVVDAQAVLTSAADLVASPRTSRLSCTTNSAPAIRAAYETAARQASLPAGWPASSISVPEVRFWYGGTGESFGSTCRETATNGLVLQLVTVEIRPPGGGVQRTEVVKGSV
jgi:type II secretory pathway pseudopilin PulG